MKRDASNLSTLKNDNRALILNEIRKAPVARSQLAGMTKLTKSAVTTIVGEMIAQGLVVETTLGTSSKGRKPILLDIVPGYRYAAGVDLHRKRISAAITDLKTNFVGSVCAQTADFESPVQAIDWVCRQIVMLMRKNKLPMDRLIGVSVSSPGPLDYQKGIILDPPNFPLFTNTPVTALIRERLRLPVVLENNSVALAMREYFYGSMKNYRSSLFVIVSNGVGSCAIMDGQVYRGFAGFAGELGHISVDQNGPPCSCGNRGCLELYINKATLLAQHGFEDYEGMTNAAYRGDEEALAALEEGAHRLGAALINAVNLLDLDSIILFGELNYRPELLLEKIRRIVEGGSMVCRAHGVAIAASDFDERSYLAASTVPLLNQFFNQSL